MLLRYLVDFPASTCEAASKGQVVSDWIEIQKAPKHIAREKQKARDLRQSQWWRNKIAQGLCAYCQGTFAPDTLTMDHIVPISRGGRSTKGNVVPCCAACNATKKYWTPAELLLQQLRGQESK
jgi:5-methylcytosine-specific restriction enzyme A